MPPQTAKKSQANVSRKLAARYVEEHLRLLRLTCGGLVKTTRAYAGGASISLTQAEVAQKSGVDQSKLTSLENGKKIPDSADLRNLMDACGFDMNETGAQELFGLLNFLRDRDLAQIGKDKTK